MLYKKIAAFLLYLLPLKFRLDLNFLRKLSRNIDWKNPKTFNEKIQLRKLNLKEEYSQLADKYQVRNYVSEKIGNQYLIPLLDHSESIERIDFGKLPGSFVIKTNHGSGDDHIEIIKNKKIMNKERIVRKFTKSIEGKYIADVFGETHYSDIPRKIVVEKLMLDDGNIPSDFKFHVFTSRDGSQRWILQVDFDRFSDHKRNMYDENLSLLDFSYIYKKGSYQLENRDTIFEMAEVAKKLAEEFNYVRVDLYLINNNIYFGEMTFLPDSGFGKFSPIEGDEFMGSMWEKDKQDGY